MRHTHAPQNMASQTNNVTLFCLSSHFTDTHSSILIISYIGALKILQVQILQSSWYTYIHEFNYPYDLDRHCDVEQGIVSQHFCPWLYTLIINLITSVCKSIYHWQWDQLFQCNTKQDDLKGANPYVLHDYKSCCTYQTSINR